MADFQPSIEFEKDIYLPGEEVTGRAWLSTNKNMKAKSVEITFTGKSVSAWKGGKTVPTKPNQKAEEIYVEMKHEVWTPDDEENTFPSGDYEWKFSFELPKNCPPSFEGKSGFIRYSVLLYIDVPNGKAKNIERAVTVSPIIDLNNITGAGEPIKMNVDTTAYFCQCMPCLPARGNVVYTLSSPKLGHVPGEAVSVSGQINNGTSKPIRIIQAKLNRRITYREELQGKAKNKKRNAQNADGFKSKIETQVLETKIERCNIPPHTNSDFAFAFVIPPVIASIRNSKFITVDYFVSIWGDTGICNRTEPASLNILVGNVPLASGTASLPPQKFVDGNAAQCWNAHLKPEFTYQIPSPTTPETELHVEFDQPQEVFFPGHPISGRVVLLTEDKYKAKTVNVNFEEIAHTYWDDDSSVRRTEVAGQKIYYNQRVHYSADVNYLEHKLLLWSSGDGSNELAPGKYVWPFSYNLPNDIPPSFEGKYGYVRYSVTTEVDRPWRFDKAKKLCITVSPLLDLNIIPHAMTPLQDQASENLGCCCFKKGYLEMRVNIPKTGFVPGETVPINLEILNHSSVPVTEVKVKIIQQCTFVAFRNGSNFNFIGDSVMAVSQRETKHDTNTVIKQSQALTVEPGKEHRLALELRLPSVTPTINQFSPIITVEYLVQVSVDTSSTFGSDIDCEMSILIGTVPIRQYLPPAYYPPNPAFPPAIPSPMPTQIGSGVVVPPPEYGFVTTPADIGTGVVPPYPDCAQPYPTKGDTVVVPSAPPLSYQDSMYGTDGTQLNTDENQKPFVPKYPVFNNLPIYNPSAPPQE